MASLWHVFSLCTAQRPFDEICNRSIIWNEEYSLYLALLSAVSSQSKVNVHFTFTRTHQRWLNELLKARLWQIIGFVEFCLWLYYLWPWSKHISVSCHWSLRNRKGLKPMQMLDHEILYTSIEQDNSFLPSCVGSQEARWTVKLLNCSASRKAPLRVSVPCFQCLSQGFRNYIK